MKYNKLLVLLFIPLFFSIVKADGCGLTCPKGSHNHMEFALILVCNLFTWSFCHIFSFFLSVIIVVIIFVFWYIQPPEKKKKVKYLLYALTGIVVFILFYPYIRAFTQTTPSVPTTTTTPTDTCEFFENSTCEMLYEGYNVTHIPYVSVNHWRITCATGNTGRLQTSTNNIQLSSIETVWNDPLGSTTWFLNIRFTGDFVDVNATNYTIGSPYFIAHVECSG